MVVVINGGIYRVGATQSQNLVHLNVLLCASLFVQRLCSGVGMRIGVQEASRMVPSFVWTRIEDFVQQIEKTLRS